MKPRPRVSTRVETYVIRVTIRWRRRLSMPFRAKKLHLGMHAQAKALVSSHHWAADASIANPWLLPMCRCRWRQRPGGC